VRAAESALGKGTALSEAVARYLFKLMAYKDEYEVARLHTDPAFQKMPTMFEGDYKIVHHLAPPMLAKRNAKGELVKQAYGPWMRSAFGWLAKLKGLRGGALDLFGNTEERRTERQLITDYEACIDELLKRPDGREAGAGGRDRAHPRRDPRLRPREGTPPGRRARQVGRADGQVEGMTHPRGAFGASPSRGHRQRPGRAGSAAVAGLCSVSGPREAAAPGWCSGR
jgi:hypothetical protein